jgi:hypothetical protein
MRTIRYGADHLGDGFDLAGHELCLPQMALNAPRY